MSNWRPSAAYRIALAHFLAFAIGLAVLGTVVFEVMHVAFLNQVDSEISDEAQTLVDEFKVGGAREVAEAISEREMSASHTRMLYAVFAPDGKRISGSLRTARPGLGIHDITFADPSEGPDTARGIAVDLSPGERLLVAADREWIERIDETVILVFGIAFLIACGLAFMAALVLGGYLRRRLRTITSGAEAIIGGDIRARMPVSSLHDEFDEVAATLNRMLDRIEGLLENLRQVSSDIAHDLRTPLARLRNQLERENITGSDSGVVIADAVRQVDEVLALFAAILRIAEVESGETRRFFKPVDLSAMITELAESYVPAFSDEGRTLRYGIGPHITLYGEGELIIQAFANLLENAQRHTDKGTVVSLFLDSDGIWIRGTVVDNGKGVADADIDRISKRFTRIDTSRNTEGYGLGLSLVSAVAKLHGGRLVLENAGPGLSAMIELPASSGPVPERLETTQR